MADRGSTAAEAPARPSGWRNLAAFWVLLCVCAASAAGVLQVLGPPNRPAVTAAAAPPAGGRPAGSVVAPVAPPPAAEAAGHAPAAEPAAPPVATAAATPGQPVPREWPRPPGTAIPAPFDALLEPAPDFPGSRLPRVGTGPDAGVMPMKVYAGGFDPAERRPRIALLLAGLGLSAADSADAIARTPAGVTLAFSPYAATPDLSQVRARGHEFLISLPMEPAGYPLNDEGPQSLLTGSSADDNELRLEWALSRIQGYAGATGALGGLRGERFAGAGEQMARVIADLRRRGLYYIDPRTNQAAIGGIPGRGVDVVVDEAAAHAGIDANLARLEQIAIDRGVALGLAGAPRPVTVERIAAWAGRLASHGIVLVPVSALLVDGATVAQTARNGTAR